MSTRTIRAYEIDDVPGHKWELHWSDSAGEESTVEHRTDADLLEAIKDLLDTWARESTPSESGGPEQPRKAE